MRSILKGQTTAKNKKNVIKKNFLESVLLFRFDFHFTSKTTKLFAIELH